MAKPAANKSETTVTRIKASESESSSKTKPITSKPTRKDTDKKPSKKSDDTTVTTKRKNVFVRIGTYFKGAWTELRLVRWPDRKATWGMTGALLVFTLFFVVVILILDFGFSKLFNLILGSN